MDTKLLTKFKKFAVHHIDDVENLPFSKQEYSRFKCGVTETAHKYGKEIAEKFCKDVLDGKLTMEDQIVVFPSAYSYIPCAAAVMTKYFIRYVNYWLLQQGLPTVIESRIHRKRKYGEEYGTLSKEERLERLSGDTFRIDTNLTKGKILIFMDDVFITGAHQIKVSQIIKNNAQFKPKDIWFVYYAMLVNDTVSPAFESVLNFAEITDIHGIDKLYDEYGGSAITVLIRTSRYVLQASEEDFYHFIGKRTQWEKEDLYYSAVCEEYHLQPKFQENLNRLKILLNL